MELSIDLITHNVLICRNRHLLKGVCTRVQSYIALEKAIALVGLRNYNYHPELSCIHLRAKIMLRKPNI